MALSTPGIGSGLDVNGIVTQLVQFESRPLANLTSRRVDLESQVSGFGKLKDALSTFKSAMDGLGDVEKFQKFTASSSDDTVYDASASSTAATGSYDITINRIAENHRLASGNVFADTGTTTIGTAGDTVTITVGTSAYTVDYGGKTLAQVRDAINQASDNTGATATIITDDTGNHLLLSADSTGSKDLITLSYSATDPFSFATLNTDRDGSGSFAAADLDAELVVQGQFTATKTSNSVSDVIQGVTLTLEKAGTATLDVNRDIAGITNSVQTFTSAYNALFQSIEDLRGNELKSDSSSLLNVQSVIRSVLQAPPVGITSQFSQLFEVGITTARDGTLAFDSSDLATALDTDFAGVAQLFANDDQGFAFRLEALADNFLATDGLIDSRTTGLNVRIDGLKDQAKVLEYRLTQTEARLRAQFQALDGLVSNLTATNDFLTSALGALPGFNSLQNGNNG